MIPIDSHTVAVENEAELRTYVSANNGMDYVYLAEDITLLNGITIYAGKETLVIDGEYPPASGIFHTFTDMDSILPTATLGVRAQSNIKLTFQNMFMVGRNYYGIPFIDGESWFINNSNVSVTYINVNYEGPQITYNPEGLTRYVNCDITISPVGDRLAQEVGEVCRVEFDGVNTIRHNGESDAVFWFRGDVGAAYLHLLPNAKVTINSKNYFTYNMKPKLTPITRTPVNIALLQGSSLELNVLKGISLDSSHTASSFLVEEDASFRYIQAANNGNSATLYLTGALTVNQRGSFYMQAVNGTQPLIYYPSGSPGRLTLNDPLSFVLYSPNTAALFSAPATPFLLHGGQLNIWNTLSRPVETAGTFDDEPDYKWHKQDYLDLINIPGTFTAASTSLGAHNITAEDEGYNTLSFLRLDTAKVISVGDIRIMENPVVDDGRPITGWTELNANMKIKYTISTTAHSIDGKAGEDGQFSIATSGEVPPKIPAGTEVEIWVNTPFLIKKEVTVVVEAGEFMIVRAPQHIVFDMPAISTGTDVFLRRYYPGDDEPVEVLDSRTDSTDWELLASITGDLETETGYTLPDALVFRDELGELTILSDTPTVVYTGQGNGGVKKTTEVTWVFDQGILLHVTGPIRRGVKYSTDVKWALHIVEEP